MLVKTSHQTIPIRKNLSRLSIQRPIPSDVIDLGPITIPRKIHKIWITNTDVMSLEMADAIETFRIHNPHYTLQIYNKQDCLDYIIQYYDTNIMNTYQKLKPYAYKSDLMRLLILYQEGGYYSDMKQVCLMSFDDMFPSTMQWFTTELKWDPDPIELQNSFIACIPKHPWIKRAIDIIVHNVQNEYYGTRPIDPTGPTVLSLACNIGWYSNSYFGKFVFGRGALTDDIYDHNVNKIILHKYKKIKPGDWIQDGGNDYVQLWNSHDIYEKN